MLKSEGAEDENKYIHGPAGAVKESGAGAR